ncbi:MAG: PEP-CTERM sorting domain-containing protein [Phycisphaerales bacterium]
MKTPNLIAISSATTLLAGLAGSAAAQSFTGLGAYPGSSLTLARGVSAGGAVVVGQASVSGSPLPWRWTQSTGMVGLGFNGYGFAVSDDGQVIAGSEGFPGPEEAYRWTPGSGMQELGYLNAGNNSSSAWAASADGSVIVGRSGVTSGPAQFEAFRWTQGGGMQGLGFLSGHTSSWAQGVSTDGTVVVGRSVTWPGGGVLPTQAFRWTPSGGMTGLGFLPGHNGSVAIGVSADGSTVVGGSFIMGAIGGKPFRWTQVGGMEELGMLPGYTSCDALSVSGDGSIVVGSCVFGTSEAFLWTPAGGMRPLLSVLVNDYGLNLTGWQLGSAFAISADGRAIVGSGTYLGGAQVYLAVLSGPCYPDCNESGNLTLADFGCFQGKYVLNDPYADCNASGTLTVADFGCFQTKFVAGCP